MKKLGTFLLLTAILLGCAKTPEVPTLPGSKKDEIEQIVVGNSFTVGDARNIFNALNKSGRLNSLKDWFTASDSELQTWADFFNEFFYEEALRHDGALAILNQRVRRKGFQRLLRSVEDWQNTAGFRRENETLFAILNSNFFPTIARQTSPLLDERILSALVRTESLVQNKYSEAVNWAPVSSPDVTLGAKEIRGFFQNPTAVQSLDQMVVGLKGSRLIENLLLSLKDQELKFQSPVAFEALAYGLGRDLKTGDTHKLLATLNLLNRPSAGLFSVADATLTKNPELGRLLGRRLDEPLARAAAHFVVKNLKKANNGGPVNAGFWKAVVRKNLTDPPTKEFGILFSVIGSGLDSLTSQGASASLVSKTPIYLASLVVAKRIEEVLRANPDKLEKLPEGAMLLSTKGTLELTETPEIGKTKLNGSISRDLEGMEGMTPFRDVLASLVVQETFGPKTYIFNERGSVSIEALIEDSLQIAQATHRFADASGLLMPVIRLIAGGTPNGFSLGNFETTNMLNSLHRFLSGISLETWNQLDYFLFEVLRLGRLEEGDKQLFLQLYLENEGLMDRASDLLNSLEILHKFSQPVKRDLPSVVSFCHFYLSNVRPKERELGALAHIFTFFSDAKFLEKTEAGNELRYPWLYGNLEAGKPVARLLYQLSLFNEDERDAFLSAFNSSLTPELLQFVKRVVLENPQAIETIAFLILEKGSGVLPTLSALPVSEREFAIRFLSSKHLEKIWRFIQVHGSKGQFRSLLRDLKGLVKDGSVLDASRLLGKIQNPLLKEVARVIESMVVSGEFEAVLETLEGIVPDSH